jgi:hypothetical protein
VAAGSVGIKGQLEETAADGVPVPLAVSTCCNDTIDIVETGALSPGTIVLQTISALLLGDFSHNLNGDRFNVCSFATDPLV